MDQFVGKVDLFILPNVKRPHYRWIVRKREDGRYVARVPNMGVLIRDLTLKRERDYGKETLLPRGSKPWMGASNHRKSQKRTKKRTQTRTKKRTQTRH
jgi:hypothetical protein